MTRAPGKVSSATNLVKIFDVTSWLFIFVSVLLFSLVLNAFYKVGLQYGLRDRNSASIMLTPFAMLNAEDFPPEVSKSTPSELFLTRGFSRNLLFLLWSVLGMVLVFSFTCNLRAMIMKPQMEAPKDTSKDLITSGTIPIVISGFNQEEILATSENEWQRKASDIKFSQKNPADTETNLKTLVQKEGTHAIIANPEEISYAVKKDPFYKKLSQPVFHFSRENIESYYVGWVTGKTSLWKSVVDDHVGLVLQVKFHSC